ncbi:CU044_5270 family protein [Krasilnikovia sp. MM14-A1259]|uniref:CU044_5270 family protein n=1 Tax=Krasilnikovia sp. MM14-A1259 TaxID=3373539 RepID=UPI0037FDF912
MTASRSRFTTLAALRPVSTVQQAWPQDQRDAILRRILSHADSDVSPGATPAGHAEAASGRRRPASVRRRLVLAGALTAVLGAAAAVPSLVTSPSYAATPAMLQFVPVAGQQSSASVLTDLARRASTRPPAAGHGRYTYLHTKGWYLHVSADGNNRILDSGTAEVDRQLWLAPDGSGRLRQLIPGDNMPPDKTLRPGEFDGAFLPADATTTAVRTKYGHDDTAAGWTRTMMELWGRQVVPAALHARLLDTLAGQPGVNLLGDTTDRAGRHGVAIGVEDQRGPRERMVLVFDPDTGALLDAETVVLENSELPVHPPATISYTVWVATGHTETTTSLP